jgi:hypothetical protein
VTRRASAAALLGCVLVLLGCADDGGRGELAGTYDLDAAGFAHDEWTRASRERAAELEALGLEARALELERIRREAAERASSIGLRLTLSADGTFEAAWRRGDRSGAQTGTWVREGDLVRLSAAAADGGPLGEGTATEATWQDGRLHFGPERVPVPFVLTRR